MINKDKLIKIILILAGCFYLLVGVDVYNHMGDSGKIDLDEKYEMQINENISLKEYTITSLQEAIYNNNTEDVYNVTRYNEKENVFYVESHVSLNKNEFVPSTEADEYYSEKLSEYKKTLARWNVDVIIWVYDENGDLCKIYK